MSAVMWVVLGIIAIHAVAALCRELSGDAKDRRRVVRIMLLTGSLWCIAAALFLTFGPKGPA